MFLGGVVDFEGGVEEQGLVCGEGGSGLVGQVYVLVREERDLDPGLLRPLPVAHPRDVETDLLAHR